MYCPSCGIEDRQANQFCRACGADLRSVRGLLERPDPVTASAQNAREQIGRTIAAKIQEMRTAKDMAIMTEEILPEIEKFLESPHEKRLRRIRNGMVVTSIGLSSVIGFGLAALFADEGIFVIAAAGLVTLFIGLCLVINAYFFTIPKREFADNSRDAASQREIDIESAETTSDLKLPPTAAKFSSVVEDTTKHLKERR